MGENTMYNGDGFQQQHFTAVAMTPEAFKDWVRKARASGMPLNAARLKAISQRGTLAQLIAALGPAKSTDGNVYFSGATPALFHAVVKATMDGTEVIPADAGAATGAAPASAARKPAEPVVEKIQ
jgi:cytochrome o ubiquinol oxidase subunit 2